MQAPSSVNSHMQLPSQFSIVPHLYENSLIQAESHQVQWLFYRGNNRALCFFSSHFVGILMAKVISRVPRMRNECAYQSHVLVVESR